MAVFFLACGGSPKAQDAKPTPAVAVSVQVGPAVEGRLSLAMSTSFQPAEWDDVTFQDFPGATLPLGALAPQHIRLQPLSAGVPQTGPGSWDFTTVDAIAQVVLQVGDRSPEFQIAVAPAFMRDASGAFVDPSYRQFATYAQNLVRYYNKGGFEAQDGRHVSKGTPITWWGIFNEPNGNGVSASEYTRMYNALVPSMQAIDKGLKFVALELSDYGDQEQQFVPPFVAGVEAKVDVLATHFYSTCNQRDTDQQLFSTVAGFGAGVGYILSELRAKDALRNVPVWVTENNVNADFDLGNGLSACNPGQPFVTDKRGSSAFFAAWRPLVFAHLGRAGAGALYHWVFSGDPQYGELDSSTGLPRLSYWVDETLAHTFPAHPGADILEVSDTAGSGVEVLAVRNADSSVVVMVVNDAVRSPTDNDGPGLPIRVGVDVGSLESFQTATLLTLDASTDLVAGPKAVELKPAQVLEVPLGGYGTAILTLK